MMVVVGAQQRGMGRGAVLKPGCRVLYCSFMVVLLVYCPHPLLVLTFALSLPFPRTMHHRLVYGVLKSFGDASSVDAASQFSKVWGGGTEAEKLYVPLSVPSGTGLRGTTHPFLPTRVCISLDLSPLSLYPCLPLYLPVYVCGACFLCLCVCFFRCLGS